MLLAVATGCSSLTTRADFDRNNDFSRYRTFAWMSDDPVLAARGATAQVSPLNRQRIVQAIEAELRAKGFTLAARRANADFVVDYTVGSRDRIDVDSYPTDFRGPWSWGWPRYWREVDVSTYTEGRLAVDIFDGRTRRPVWHGLGKRRISAADIARAESEIPKAVSAILAPFPPR